MVHAAWLLAVIVIGGVVHAQDAPELQTIRVTSRPIGEDLVKVPAAVGVVDRTVIQDGRQQLALDEALVRIPGLFLQNRYNFAQDLRIASRGFGARSNFGIRGLKVFVDGIPATLPDGQTAVDSIDLGSTARVEVLRGPASWLYGASAGGAIHIRTEEGPEQPFVEGRVSFGAYGFERYQFKAGGRAGPLDYLVSLSRFELDGYREQSRTRTSLLNSRFRYTIDESSDLSLIVNAVDSPRADDPGGLTREQVREDRRQASARNLLFDAGENLDQQTLGVVYRKSFGLRHAIAARGHLVRREFENRLPFTNGGSVDLDRWFGGGGLGYSYASEVLGHGNRLALGFDVDAQRDERKRFDNREGSKGPLRFDQDEDVTALGFYVQDQLELDGDVALTVGARYDRVEFRVDDHVLSDLGGDGSGHVIFHEFSPAVALLWSPFAGLQVYGNLSTSFETPTTTEFANASGGGGFNRSLDAQTATNYEIGAKGLLPGRLRYGLALFWIDVKDELVPFELPDMSGRSFFRNAGRSTRRGVEFELILEPVRGLTAALAYTYSDFTFDRFRTGLDVFDGNRLAGIPRDQIYGEISYRHPSGLSAAWEVLYVGGRYADDANRVRSSAYAVSSLRLGQRVRVGGLEIAPFVGVNNLFDETYDDNVRINAFGGRSFEPAPARNVYGGLRIRYEFAPLLGGS